MRTYRLGIGFVAALAAAAWGSGCGGNVVVDGVGSGGSGAGTSGSSTSAGSPTATSTGASGGDPKSLCLSFCQRLDENKCDTSSLDECVSGCIEPFKTAPQCSDEATTYLECLNRSLSGCEFPSTCRDASDALDACTGVNTCGQGECSGASDGSCSCAAVCGDRDLRTDCVSAGSELRCNCFERGQVVGVCGQDVTQACNIEGSCCGSIFFGAGVP